MQARSVCIVSYRAALHRQEKTWQYASLRLLAYRESLFVQGHMVTDDGPVGRLFDDMTLLALHRITACHATGRSSAALPDIPAPSGEGLGIREMEEEPFEVSMRFAPEAAGSGTSVAKCMTTVPSRCLSGRITRRSVFPGCWALLTGPRCWPRTGCAGRSKKRSMPWPACTTRRTNRQTRPKAAARLPRPAPCGCGSNPRCRTCVHPYRMFLYQVLRLGPPRSHPRRFQSVRTLPLPQRLKGSWDPHAPPCRDSPFLSRVMGKKYFAASEGYGIESIGNENEFLFHNKGRTA